MRFPALLLLACAVIAAPLPGADIYVIDPAHSSVTFNARHFLGRVPGWFTRFSGTLHVDHADLTRSSVEATVDVASLSTNQEKRDTHLRTPDFFDSASHPTATFRSTHWTKTGDNTYDVTGLLALHGITREITLQVKYLGRAPGNRGATLTGWEATTTLRRADFAIGQPEPSIGDEVTLTINVEARLQPPETTTTP